MFEQEERGRLMVLKRHLILLVSVVFYMLKRRINYLLTWWKKKDVKRLIRLWLMVTLATEMVPRTENL